MSYECILYSVVDGVATLELNRPDRLNSFNKAMHEEVRHALNAIDEDSSVRVLVLRASGRAFCAGQDLLAEEVQFSESGDAPDFEKIVQTFYKPMITHLRQLRVPTVAAVQGVAAGAGASLAFACDLVIAAHSANFIQAFSRIGLIPDSGGTWFLPRFVGLPRAMGLALLGEKLSAEKAEEWGLIWKAVDDLEFEDFIRKISCDIAQMPTRALVEIRSLMETSTVSSLNDQMDLEAKVMGQLGNSRDYYEGVHAFIEKREPVFKGE